MELHQLRYFTAVADVGSFTRAAEQCLIAQPSLSQQIAKLEMELGQKLFERLGKKVLLTDAGRMLYEKAASILAKVEDALRQVRDRDEEHGSITIGAIPTVAPYLLPRVLERFLRRHPNVEVTVNEDVTERLVKACQSGEADLIVLALPINVPMIEAQPILSEDLLLAVPAQHALAKKSKISMKDIASEPFILLHEAHCLSGQILSFCHDRSCRPTTRCHSAQLLMVQELVSLGQGISMIPQMACQTDFAHRCSYRSLSDMRPMRTIAAAWHAHRYQSPVMKSFFAELQKYGAEFMSAAKRRQPAKSPAKKRSKRRVARKV